MLHKEGIDLALVNYLISLKLSPNNIHKRMYRAKKRGDLKTYLALCIMRSYRDFNKEDG